MSQTRISKEECKDVSYAMCKSLNAKISDAEKNLKALIEKELIALVPKDVMDVYAKHPKYINTYNNYVRSEGKNITYIYESNAPSDGEKATLSKSVHDSQVNIDNLCEERKLFRREVESLLYSLRSFKRISENFPEAAKFLPSKDNTSMMVSCDSVRKKLKQINL